MGKQSESDFGQIACRDHHDFRRLQRGVFAAVFTLILLAGVACFTDCTVTPDGYVVSSLQTGAGLEYRLKLVENGTPRHFGTLIVSNGAVAFRPHPGVDPDGWGSTWYPQPFMAGAVLGHSAVDSINAMSDGIEVKLSGDVSSGTGSTYGAWTLNISFTYDWATKSIAGEGSMSVALDGAIDNTTGDLNLYKIASNYLDDVPLLSGGAGDTGDMEYAAVVANGFNFDWYPPLQPAHFPADLTDMLSIDVKGQYNEVDSAAQGHAPIEAAYKPSLKVLLQADAFVLTFGGFYDTSVAQDFWEDNVGITPLIRAGTTGTNFNLGVGFESQALPGDGI
ncbi:MAG: hypothetical protein AMXMBFR84_35120 [Candidatus Hydrogenedentota bacterium]